MTLRVRFAETDQMGVAHHSAYLVWLEVARVEWLRERGLSYRQLEEQGISLAVSEAKLTYRRPARFDDALRVESRLREARSRRFRFDYRILRLEDGELLAEASTVHTPTDRLGRARRLPEAWLAHLAPYLSA